MADPYSNVKSFAGAAFAEARAAMRGEAPVSDGELGRRLALCQSCPHLRGSICAICECIVGIKARYRTQACPEGRWG